MIDFRSELWLKWTLQITSLALPLFGIPTHALRPSLHLQEPALEFEFLISIQKSQNASGRWQELNNNQCCRLFVVEVWLTGPHLLPAMVECAKATCDWSVEFSTHTSNEPGMSRT